MRTINTTLLAVSLFATQQVLAKENWVDLFNGKDLTGWTQKTGNATYTAEDGCIVGTMNTPGNGTNSFLFTTKNYDNFIFEMDFKADPRTLVDCAYRRMRSRFASSSARREERRPCGGRRARPA